MLRKDGSKLVVSITEKQGRNCLVSIKWLPILIKLDLPERIYTHVDRLWMKTVGPELKAGWNLRQLFSSLSDEQVNALVELGTRDDIMGLVRRLAHFDWHRNLILSSLKLPALQEVAHTGLW